MRTDDGRPFLVQRFEFDIIAPTGQYQHNADLNQSSGYFSINSYWSATLLPTPNVEVSWRLHYLYNFKNYHPASSTPMSFYDLPVDNTQAGQAAWINFAASYAITPTFHIGINDYFFRQFTDDKVNVSTFSNSREQVLGIGPGVLWQLPKGRALWVNVYTETAVRNRAKNDLVVQAQVLTPF